MHRLVEAFQVLRMVLVSMSSLKVLLSVQLVFFLLSVSVDSSSILPTNPIPPPLSPPKPSPTLSPKHNRTLSPPVPSPRLSPPKPSPRLSPPPPKPSPTLSPPKRSPKLPPPKPSPKPSPPKPSPALSPPKPSPPLSPPKSNATPSPPKPTPAVSPPKPSPTPLPPKPSPTMSPPKPSPTVSPLPPKPSPPLSAPTPSPVGGRELIAVEGYVYCKSCKQFRPKKFTIASPLAGAIVKLECKHRKSPPIAVTAVAGENGHYLFQPPKEVATISEAHKCRVFLVSSPSSSCKVPTRLNRGKNGAHLKLHPKQPAASVGYTLYKVAPLAFAPDVKTCKKL